MVTWPLAVGCPDGCACNVTCIARLLARALLHCHRGSVAVNTQAVVSASSPRDGGGLSMNPYWLSGELEK